MRVGLISDTHGLLRPEAVEYLRGSDHIIHAGDIGRPGLVAELEALAPVTAIRGNIDRESWADRYPESATLSLGGVSVHVVHALQWLALDPIEEGVSVIVCGHSHKPSIEELADGVVAVNPGAAGKRRFTLPISVGELRIEDGRATPHIEFLLRFD